MHHISMSMNKTFIRDNTNIVLLLENCGYCIASDEITTGGKLVGYMYREQAEDDSDSGWRFFSGEETQEYADDPENFGIYDVNTIANYDQDIIPYISAPVGSEYVRMGNKFLCMSDTDNQ